MTPTDTISTPPHAASAACAHCSLPVPAGLIEPAASQQFCCAGCRAVYQTLHACGLESYYRLREAAEAPLHPASPAASSFASFDSPAFHGLYVQQSPDGAATVDLVLEGVTCAACVWLVERLPRVLDGVIEARLSLREATVRVTWDTAKLPLSRVAQALNRLGYTPHPARGASSQQIHRRETRQRIVHLGIAGAIMGNTMLLALALYAGDVGHMEARYRLFFRALSALLGVISLAWPGATFFRGAFAALRMRTTNFDVPIALALAVGGIAGLVNVLAGRGDIYFDSLSVLVFLLLVGRFLQYRQQRRADDAVGLLFSLTPSSCRIVRGDEVLESPIEALKIDDIVEVRCGDLFPADGVVVWGRSSVNQALLTGESKPVTIQEISVVHAGSQNVTSLVRVRVSKVANDTRIGQLMTLIERGLHDKPQIVQFADRVGRWFIVIISLAAAGVFAFWSRHSIPAAIDHTVALLIVTCPCVLGLATPLTIAIAIGRLARRDILVKSGAVLERLSRGGRLLLDKTGTLTEGKMQLVSWTGPDDLKSVVAAMEQKSNHPIGRALHDALADREASAHVRTHLAGIVEAGDGGISATIDDLQYFLGSRPYLHRHNILLPDSIKLAADQLERQGATAVILAVDDTAVAVAGLGDRIRDEATSALAHLRSGHWHPQILSGDASQVVRHVAHCVGIPQHDSFGQLTPEDKLNRAHHPNDSAITVMIGDGVNDAAALAAADVGIAVHGGAEASLAAADVYIARPGLDPVVHLFDMSRRTMRTVRRNLFVSLSYNLIAGALAAAGLMTPLIAAIIMPISSATVLSLAVASISRTGGRSWK